MSTTCLHPIRLSSGEYVPCGKCPNCEQNKRNALSTRLQLESAFNSGSSFFVTLTYEEENRPRCSEFHEVPKVEYTCNWIHKNYKTKEVDAFDLFSPEPYKYMSFCVEDVKKFFKILRKHQELGSIKYFLTAEYGEKTFRNHYHFVLFTSVPVLLEHMTNLIQKDWGLGFIKCCYANDNRNAYACKYMMKSQLDALPFPRGHASLPFRLFSHGLGSSSIPFINDYIYNDGKNIREYFRFNGKNVIFDQFFKKHIDPSVYEELRLKRLSHFEERQENLYNSRIAHSKKVFDNSETPDYSYDQKIIQHRKTVSNFKKSNVL